MKKFSIIIFICTFCQQLNAQQAFEKRNNFIQVGYGPGLLYDQVFSAYDNFSKREYKFSGFGPAYLGYERALTKHLGVGLAVSFSQYGADWDSTGTFPILPKPAPNLPQTYQDKQTNYSINYQSLSVMARFAYHIALCDDQLDPYYGIGLGYTSNTLSWSSTPNDTSFTEKSDPIDIGSSISYQVFVGARFMFSKSRSKFLSRCGLMAEIGYFGIFAGVPYGNIGLTFKF